MSRVVFAVSGWLSVIVPGLLVAATGVGAGDLATASFAGSYLGVAILWAVVVGGAAVPVGAVVGGAILPARVVVDGAAVPALFVGAPTGSRAPCPAQADISTTVATVIAADRRVMAGR